LAEGTGEAGGRGDEFDTIVFPIPSIFRRALVAQLEPYRNVLFETPGLIVAQNLVIAGRLPYLLACTGILVIWRSDMILSVQDGLVYLMVVTAAADRALSDKELTRMSMLVERLPIFRDYNRDRLPAVAAECADLLSGIGIEGVLELVIAKLPKHLHDTAYALAVEIAAADLDVKQEELRWLEMVRDALDIDRLTTAAIEVAARARLRKA